MIRVAEFHVAKDLNTSAGGWATCIPEKWRVREVKDGTVDIQI